MLLQLIMMEQLKLENQLCFPFYSVSRLIIRKYQPHLEELGITYPQYLVLLVLWEQDHQTVNRIAQTLYLQTNTITPLLKRLELQGVVERRRSEIDERKILISLTDKGKNMKKQAVQIPYRLMQNVTMSEDKLVSLRDMLKNLIEILK